MESLLVPGGFLKKKIDSSLKIVTKFLTENSLVKLLPLLPKAVIFLVQE